MSFTRFIVGTICCLLLSGFVPEAAGQSTVGQYEVKVYKERDYVGESKSYVLNTRSHRIALVNKLPANLDNAVSSIHVGPHVYAILFDYHDFHIKLAPLALSGTNWFESLVKTIVDIHLEIATLGFMPEKKSSSGPVSPQPGTDIMGNINVGIYTGSTPMVLHNDVYTSMLIIPKDFDHAYGVALYNYADGFIRVEPIADEKKFKERRIPDFGDYMNNKIDHVAFLGPRIKNTTITLYDDPNYKGSSITLPGEGSNVLSYNLNNYSFASKTQSIRLRVEPFEKNVTRAAAPAAESSQAQVVATVIPLKLPGAMATAVESGQVKVAEPAAQTQQPGQKPPAQQSGQSPQGQPSGWNTAGQGQPQQQGAPTAEEPGQAGGWVERPDPDMPHDEQGEDPDLQREEPEHQRTGWEQHPEHPPHEEELPPGMPDVRGRWKDNHGNYFEIIQHGPGFVMLGDGVPVHGSGILTEPGKIGMVVQAEGQEMMQLKGRIEREGEEGTIQRIVLENGIVLER